MSQIYLVLENWNIGDINKIDQVYKSAWEINESYVLKVVNKLSEIEKSICIASVLSARGIPVAPYIQTNDGNQYVSTQDGHYCLMHKVKGVHLDIYSSDYQKMSYKIGQIIARLHISFKECENHIVCNENNLLQELDKYVLSEIYDKKIEVPRFIIEYIERIKKLYPSLTRQIIHRDMHLGNLLFRDDELVGYIDFDITQKSIRIFDICYFLLSILVDHYTDKRTIYIWKEIYNGVIRGYSENSPLSHEEYEALPYVFLYIELVFAAYFSRIGLHDLSMKAVNMLNWLYVHRGLLENCNVE